MRDEEKLRRSSPPLWGRDGLGSSQYQEVVRDRTLLLDGIDYSWSIGRPQSRRRAVSSGAACLQRSPFRFLSLTTVAMAASWTDPDDPSLADGTPPTHRSRWTPQAALWSSGSAPTAVAVGSRPPSALPLEGPDTRSLAWKPEHTGSVMSREMILAVWAGRAPPRVDRSAPDPGAAPAWPDGHGACQSSEGRVPGTRPSRQ
jgi:hypothetical protein